MKLFCCVCFAVAFLAMAACQSDDNFIVPEPIVVAFTASDTIVVQGSEVTFINQSTGVDSTATYRWIFEGGTPVISEEAVPPPVVYKDTGRYFVVLQILVPLNDSSWNSFEENKHINVRPN